MKTKLKHILNVEANKSILYGKTTYYMVWSPTYHQWFYPSLKDWNEIPKKELKFLMNQEVIKLSIRNDMDGYIAIFLKSTRKTK